MICWQPLVRGLVVASCLGAAGFLAPSHAEPVAVAAAEPAGEKKDVAEPVESHDRLKAAVRPLTEAELADLAAVWRDRLKDKVREISAVRVGAETRSDAAKPPPGSELSRLQEERTILTDRLRVVLDEWERKGGDPK